MGDRQPHKNVYSLFIESSHFSPMKKKMKNQREHLRVLEGQGRFPGLW